MYEAKIHASRSFYNLNDMKAKPVSLVITLLLCSSCALQSDLVILDRRVTALRQQVSQREERIKTLNSEIATYQNKQIKTDRTLHNKQADFGALLNRIRNRLQELRGRLEENEYYVKRREDVLANTESRQEERWKALEKSFQSSLDRIVRLEQYLGMEPSEKLKSPSTEKSNTSAKKTPDNLYVKAKQQFDKGKYEAARNLFQSFLEQYPKSKEADNAQFWIGEIYYREKWYEKAILEYQKVIEIYSKGNKVSSALLKQGLAFLNLGDQDNARLILKELVRKHPGSNEAKIAKGRLEKFQ